jgi:hypothetical protein
MSGSIRGMETHSTPEIDPQCNWSLSPDGSQRAIVDLVPNQGKIRLRATSTGEARDLIVKGWNGLQNIDWSADGGFGVAIIGIAYC